MLALMRDERGFLGEETDLQTFMWGCDVPMEIR